MFSNVYHSEENGINFYIFMKNIRHITIYDVDVTGKYCAYIFSGFKEVNENIALWIAYFTHDGNAGKIFWRTAGNVKEITWAG